MADPGMLGSMNTDLETALAELGSSDDARLVWSRARRMGRRAQVSIDLTSPRQARTQRWLLTIRGLLMYRLGERPSLPAGIYHRCALTEAWLDEQGGLYLDSPAEWADAVELVVRDVLTPLESLRQAKFNRVALQSGFGVLATGPVPRLERARNRLADLGVDATVRVERPARMDDHELVAIVMDDGFIVAESMDTRLRADIRWPEQNRRLTWHRVDDSTGSMVGATTDAGWHVYLDPDPRTGAAGPLGVDPGDVVDALLSLGLFVDPPPTPGAKA